MEFCDDYDIAYDHVNVIYTPENIPTTATEHQFDDIAIGCQCNEICTTQTKCNCLRNDIKNYDFDSFSTKNDLNSVQENYIVSKKDMPIYECNQNCKCSIFCGNRLTQYGPRQNLKILEGNKDQNSKGAGVFTNKSIKNGTFICEYAGEIITEVEANLRFQKQGEDNSTNYIFCASETFGMNTIKTIVDPSLFGNIGRYINHSCQPNSEVIPVRVDCIIPKLCIFANRDIDENEEITFDYGDGELGFSPLDTSVIRKKKCFCDRVNCRKYLPFSRDCV